MDAEPAAIPGSILLPFAKKWSDDFFNSNIPPDSPYMKELQAFSPYSEGVKLFMHAYDDEFTSFDWEAVVHFCRDILLHNIHEQTKKGSAWMDDRNYASSQENASPVGFRAANDNTFSTPEASLSGPPISLVADVIHADGTSASTTQPHTNANRDGRSTSHRYFPRSRRYPAPLTAKMLYDNLVMKRYDHPDYPDSDRRLVAIANPDRYDILAVTEAAPQHQHAALRDAISRYVSLRAALKVRLSDRGLSVYQLELHLPHFVFLEKEVPRTARPIKPHRSRQDLTFLAQSLPDSFRKGNLEIEQAQISVVLCGASETRYTVYCFEDNDFEEDNEMGDDEFSDDGVQVDQVAKEEVIDANKPIWNPREYFLSVLLQRINQVLERWGRVVQVVVSASDNFTSGGSYSANNGNDPYIGRNIAESSYWTRKMLQLLGKLIPTIRETNKLWVTFISNNGDLGYFYDLVRLTTTSNNGIQRKLHMIHEAFIELERLEEKLKDVQAQCEKLERALEFRAMIEANQNTELTILYICPVTVVSTFFAIPASIIPIERNVLTFTCGLFFVTMVIGILRFDFGTRLRQQPWWGRVILRARLAYQGDPTNTVINAAGARVLRRAT